MLQHHTYPSGTAVNGASIEEAVRTLDKRRLEVRQEVCCPNGEERLHYLVETWLFLPTSLQINRWSYSPRSYRQSLKSYIRLGVPLRSLCRLAGPCRPGAVPFGGEALISEAERYFDLIAAGNGASVMGKCEDTLKLYALMYRRALLAEKRAIANEADEECRAERAVQLVHALAACLRHYRSLAARAAKVRPYMRSPCFLFCDEYMGIVTTEPVFRLLRSLPEGQAKRKVQGFWKSQMAYRQSRYPSSVPVEGSDNELPVYRWSILKKYVDRPLFLEIRPRQGNTLLAHTLYGVAAASAMIFATAIAYIWQMRYGQLSAPLFAAMVVAYIFKDRMKDVSRDRLFKVFKRWLPDRRQQLFDGQDQPVGQCAESFRFESWEKLPLNVRTLRNKTHLVDVLNSFHSEDILYYSKMVKIRTVPDPFHEGEHSILDISRFDISDFLRHAVDVLEEPPSPNDERLILGDKIYHVDMVRRVTFAQGSRLRRFRIVLTHAGIRRIDEIRPQLSAFQSSCALDNTTKDVCSEVEQA